MDKNAESILFLTNDSDKKARTGFEVTAGGIHYYLTKLLLQPHETRAINIRSLRNAQLADFRKSRIPAAATDGSVTWIRLDHVPVMGRLMVIQWHNGMNSSYDCCICPCPNSFEAVEVPNNGGYGFAFLPGSSGNFGATAVYVDCNNLPYYYDVTNTAQWLSTDTTIVTVQAGLVTGVAVGQATVSAFYWDFQYTSIGGSCSSSEAQENGYVR